MKQSIACTSAAFTPEGDKLYTGGADGKLKVWSYPDGELLDTHNMALSRGELASKCGGAEATKNIPKKKDKGIPGAPTAVPKKIEKVRMGERIEAVRVVCLATCLFYKPFFAARFARRCVARPIQPLLARFIHPRQSRRTRPSRTLSSWTTKSL